MIEFSQISRVMQEWIEDFERRSRMIPSPPFEESERTPGKRAARLKKVDRDFWYFDRTYFLPETYKQGFSEPSHFHKKLVQIIRLPGVNIAAGPRKHAKTAFGRKEMLWELLTGRLNFAATFSEDIDVARMWLKFCCIFMTRGRIADDFGIRIQSFHKDELVFDVTSDPRPGTRFVKPFSLGRSVRGQLEALERPEKAYGDDIETLDSSFTSESVRDRLNRITEAFESLDNQKGSFVIFANNFDERCVTNILLKQQEDGTISDGYRVHVFKAWDRGRPLWVQAYPAESEAELKSMLKPRDEANWQANYQQNPVPPEGFIFKRDYYQEWSKIPKDARGVMYTDQNLAKKGKGDSTAITALLFSRSTGNFYVRDARCQSFSDAHKLFKAVLDMYDKDIKGIAFDGNVSQESYWSEILDGFSFSPEAKKYGSAAKLLKIVSEFKRYRVDDIAVNLQLIYERGLLYFPPNFSETREGRVFLTQFFAFAGKKANGKDDAPDSLICAHQYLLERSLARRSDFTSVEPVIINDYYSM